VTVKMDLEINTNELRLLLNDFATTELGSEVDTFTVDFRAVRSKPSCTKFKIDVVIHKQSNAIIIQCIYFSETRRGFGRSLIYKLAIFAKNLGLQHIVIESANENNNTSHNHWKADASDILSLIKDSDAKRYKI
jgi:hypothetical protein